MLSQAIVAFGRPLAAIEAATPQPKGSQVLLKVEHAGVCHSDLHIHDGYFDLGNGNTLPLSGMKLPHTLGHEIQGEVVALGPDAAGIALGQRFAVYPWIGCGNCPACKRNEENLCTRPRQLGCSSAVAGGYATHVIVPHPKYLIDYGQTEPALAAAYMCSGLTAFAALKKIGPVMADDPLVVLGCGGVGMMAVQFAKALFGKGPIAADINADHLQAATESGATAAYNPREDGIARKFLADTGGAYAVVDFVGSESSFAFANAIVRKGGRIIIVGLFGGAMTMPIAMFPMRALTICGSFVGSLPDAQEMMALVRTGKIDPIPYQTRPLDQANASLDDLRHGRITGRVVLVP